MNQLLICSKPSVEAKKNSQKPTLGEKEFEQADLSKADFKGMDLSFANFRGANLYGADFSQSILKGADFQGANLNKVNLNGARLQGANLSETQLVWGSLIEADLSGANLSESSLDAASLKHATLQGTNLSGAYLCGADLTEAILKGAYYDNQTRFQPDFDLTKAGIKMEARIAIETLLNQFNQLSQLSQHYLGNMITARYWESSRPDFDWLKKFQIIHRSAQMAFSGEASELVEISQLQWLQLWINTFIKSCSQIVRDLPTLIEQKRLLFAVSLLDCADS